MRRWDRLLDGYIEEYRARGVSAESVAMNTARLERWGRWLKHRRPRVGIEQIGAELITRYIESCSSFRAKATVYGTLSTMRGFGDYLVRQGLWTTSPLRWMKGPKVAPYSRLPKRIDRAHMEEMWREAARRGGEYSSHLWVAVLAMLYGTGLRRGELERLNLDAFDRTEGTLRIDGRKSGRERFVPLPQMVLRCLEAYLPQRHNQLERTGLLGECALLVTRNGIRLTGNAISNGIHTISRRAGVSIHSLHQFRHTCASDLLEAGVHLAQVQRILGHCGIATTVRYVHMNGRVEDFFIGRMMSADPTIPDPADAQSYNRYSYTRNNPLTYIDASGFDDGPLNCTNSGEAVECAPVPAAACTGSRLSCDVGLEMFCQGDCTKLNAQIYNLSPSTSINSVTTSASASATTGDSTSADSSTSDSSSSDSGSQQPQGKTVPGLPDRAPAYTATPVTTPDGQQWYVFSAAPGYSFADSVVDSFKGTDVSTAFTVPTQAITANSDDPSSPGTTRISVNITTGQILSGPPSGATMPVSPAQPAAPPSVSPPLMAEPAPVDVPMPNIKISTE